jgi:hypothetical protein
VLETFHVLEIKLHHAEGRRGFEHLNYLHLLVRHNGMHKQSLPFYNVYIL